MVDGLHRNKSFVKSSPATNRESRHCNFNNSEKKKRASAVYLSLFWAFGASRVALFVSSTAAIERG